MYTVELEEFRAAYASFPKTADGKLNLLKNLEQNC
jgi:hypothetical protein